MDIRTGDTPSSSSSHSAEEGRLLLDKEVSVFTSHHSKQNRHDSSVDVEDMYFFTIRGVENLLIYAWVAKDLSWTTYYSDWIVFAIISLVLAGLIVIKTIFEVDFEDLWHRIAEFLWLFANFWWLSVS
jgi:hypothetical protein